MFGTFQATQLLSQLVNSAAVAGGIRQHVGKRGDCGQTYWWTLKCEFHVVSTDQETFFLVFSNYLETKLFLSKRPCRDGQWPDWVDLLQSVDPAVMQSITTWALQPGELARKLRQMFCGHQPLLCTYRRHVSEASQPAPVQARFEQRCVDHRGPHPPFLGKKTPDPLRPTENKERAASQV